MSDWMLGVAQMLAIGVTVSGVTVALWQVWVLANKLARSVDREAIAQPAEPEMYGEPRSSGKRVRHR